MSATSTLLQSLSSDRQLREVHHWVNGETLRGTSGQFGDVYNPATGRVQAKVALATGAEVDLAVTAAARAFPAW
jgi:malonate-semialdehyde dehydrogenase (acetylating) / methylmalonate-semialdehyde dehydrogenase